MKLIKFSIDKQGVTTLVDAEGFGTSCKSVTARVEQRLGKVDESSRENTDNMYRQVEGNTLRTGLE